MCPKIKLLLSLKMAQFFAFCNMLGVLLIKKKSFKSDSRIGAATMEVCKKKLKIELPDDPAIPTLVLIQKNPKH